MMRGVTPKVSYKKNRRFIIMAGIYQTEFLGALDNSTSKRAKKPVKEVTLKEVTLKEIAAKFKVPASRLRIRQE